LSRVGAQIKEPPHAFDNRDERTGFWEINAQIESIATGRHSDFYMSTFAIERDGAPVGPRIDLLNTRDRARRKKCQ